MSEELKPCPFCGSTDVIIYKDFVYSTFNVTCKNCGMGESFQDMKHLLPKWNTRPIEDALRAELAAVKAENERLLVINNSTYCAYCNASYERTDDALAQVRDHIAVCEHHPMRKVEAERDRYKAALEKIDTLSSSWEGRRDAPYWNLGDIARKSLKGGE